MMTGRSGAMWAVTSISDYELWGKFVFAKGKEATHSVWRQGVKLCLVPSHNWAGLFLIVHSVNQGTNNIWK